MAGTYTNSTRVNRLLPSSVPSAVSALLTDQISEASGLVEAGVGSGFGYDYNSNANKFPSITDDPATPDIIALAATYLAASMQWQALKQNVADGVESNADKYDRLGNQILTDIRDGKLEVIVSAANIKSSMLESIDDEFYDDLTEPLFSKDNLDSFTYQ